MNNNYTGFEPTLAKSIHVGASGMEPCLGGAKGTCPDCGYTGPSEACLCWGYLECSDCGRWLTTGERAVGVCTSCLEYRDTDARHDLCCVCSGGTGDDICERCEDAADALADSQCPCCGFSGVRGLCSVCATYEVFED